MYRGRGLMIGFDVPEELKDLRKNLLWKQKIFTGEAKPNVIRLITFTCIEGRRMLNNSSNPSSKKSMRSCQHTNSIQYMKKFYFRSMM